MGSNGEVAINNIIKKYFMLKPEEANILNLFSYLFSGNSGVKRFIKSLRVKETTLERSGFITLSVGAQKFLQKILACPLSVLGKIFEFWLNLLDCNGNFGLFVLNILRWKVEKPVKGSTKYLSIVGYLDRRTALDKNIKPGDKKYYAELSVLASKLAYENKEFCKAVIQDQWKMDFLGPEYDFWNDHLERYSTQGLIIHDKHSNPDMIIVAFRGTEPFNTDDWSTDVDISWHSGTIGRVHVGFMKALGLQKDLTWPKEIKEDGERHFAYYSIREKLRTIFAATENSKTRFILTGHSLGGALAIIFPAILAYHNETQILERLEGIYTFGQPRVGDKKFGSFVDALLELYGVKYYRFVYNNDIVCRVPYDNDALMFKHFRTCIYYNSLYEGKILPEEPDKNYFSFREFMTRRVDVLWEVVRSFVLPRIYGPEYREGLLLRGVRLLFGLVIPGVPEHALQDYVNAIRLGTADFFV